MDRRGFLVAGGVAAASPAFAQAVAAAPGGEAASTLFRQVNFWSDGIAPDAAEYAALLQREVAAGRVEPDNYSRGGAIEALERKFAALLGKEAAVFLPTGTLANHVAVRTLAGGDRRVLVQAESHLYCDSGDGAGTLSGLTLIPLGEGRTMFELGDVGRWVERSLRGRVEAKVGAIAVESPVRRRDHAFVPFDALERLSRFARERGIRLHLDGARLFNLPHHTGRSVRDYAALFDTVYVSLWKHFNGASGAVLAGDAGIVDGLYHVRRMFGGSLSAAWPQVAPVARFVDGYEREYAEAWRAADALIERLRGDGRFAFRKLPDGTCRFFMTVTGAAPETIAERAGRHGVALPLAVPGTNELPMQVNATILRRPVAEIAHVLVESARGR